ncbi:unnamed protein product [Trichobilharzia regenti]|nr:unnamed protein product [Trichobilharzia regenti]
MNEGIPRTDALKDLCHHRNKPSSGCDNQTDFEHADLEEDESSVSPTTHTHISPSSSSVPEINQNSQIMYTSPSENEHSKHLLSSSKIYNTPALQSPLDVSISQIDATNEAVTRGGPSLPPPPDIYSYIDTFDDIYLTPTNNEGNYPWSHKLYNSAAKVEPMNKQQSSNTIQHNDQNPVWSESWIPKLQHETVERAAHLNNKKRT